jgi:hypothetical protein
MVNVYEKLCVTLRKVKWCGWQSIEKHPFWLGDKRLIGWNHRPGAATKRHV